MYVRGQQVYHFGEPTVGFFIVSEGAVQIMVKDEEGDVLRGEMVEEEVSFLILDDFYFDLYSTALTIDLYICYFWLF
jgi:hypothetical protein